MSAGTTRVAALRLGRGAGSGGGAASLRRQLPLIALAVLVLVAGAAPLIAPYDPVQTRAGTPLSAPSWAHLLGTDQVGRDVFSRVIAGTRVSFVVGVASAALAAAVGALLGAIAATSRRWLGETLMRALDMLLAFPGILLAVCLAAALGTGMLTTIVVLSVIYTPAFARLVRASMAHELGEDYVAAARLIGTGRARLLGYHVGVNVLVPLVVYATTVAADAIIIEAGLSYIGVGIEPPTPSWGNIINDGRGFIYTGQWWISAAGGFAIFVAVLVLNAAANALNQRLDAGIERT
jgi:ABC-type dipeptide/oligopeptide/nickel transport system permease subunit